MQRFLFDTSFDDDAEEREQARLEAERIAAELEEANRPPIFTVEELEAAKEAAYASGRQQGMDDALAGLEQQVAIHLDAITSRLSSLAELHGREVARLRDEAAMLALAIARKAVPAYAKRSGLAEIEALVHETFNYLVEEPKVTIRVAPPVVEPLRPRVDEIGQRLGYEGSVVLVADEKVAEGDCRLDWPGGGMERTGERMWGEIMAAIERAVGAFDDHPAAKDDQGGGADRESM